MCPVQHEQAHEEADGESISMSSCVFRQLDLAHPFGYTPPAPIFHCESHPDGQVLSHVRINLAQHRAFISPMLLSSAAGGRVQEQEARHELVCDFPATAPSRDGKECRFVYAVTSNAPNRAFPFQVLRARARANACARTKLCRCPCLPGKVCPQHLPARRVHTLPPSESAALRCLPRWTSLIAATADAGRRLRTVSLASPSLYLGPDKMARLRSS